MTGSEVQFFSAAPMQKMTGFRPVFFCVGISMKGKGLSRGRLRSNRESPESTSPSSHSEADAVVARCQSPEIFWKFPLKRVPFIFAWPQLRYAHLTPKAIPAAAFLKTASLQAFFVLIGLVYTKSDFINPENTIFSFAIELFIFLCHSLTCAARQVIKESGLCGALILFNSKMP